MELNHDLMIAIFGNDPDDHRPRTQEQPAAEDAEARAAEYEQEVARADLSALNTHGAQSNTGQFGSRMAEVFGYATYEDRMMIRDADRCEVEDARRNSERYQALQRIRREQPALYTIIMARARYAWQHPDEMADHGPFGNNWGE